MSFIMSVISAPSPAVPFPSPLNSSETNSSAGLFHLLALSQNVGEGRHIPASKWRTISGNKCSDTADFKGVRGLRIRCFVSLTATLRVRQANESFEAKNVGHNVHAATSQLPFERLCVRYEIGYQTKRRRKFLCPLDTPEK